VSKCSNPNPMSKLGIRGVGEGKGGEKGLWGAIGRY